MSTDTGSAENGDAAAGPRPGGGGFAGVRARTVVDRTGAVFTDRRGRLIAAREDRRP